MPEFVEHEVTGLVVDPFETSELAGAISRLAGSESLREALAAAGSERLKRFTWPSITAEYERVYARVI